MPDANGVYVGLMSGTSLDGISAAVVRFEKADARLHHELVSYVSVPYDDSQRSRLRNAMSGQSAQEYCALGFDLGRWLADAARSAIAEAGLASRDVRAIASHGQTLWHIPRESTWQIGESAVIAEALGIDVISDFRVRDVAAGGEGAPLVPIADSLLYASSDEWRLLQNIGGIGNVTVVPPRGEPSLVRAFDTGPGVVLIDEMVRRLYPGLRRDDNGAIARSGRASAQVVDELLRDAYFSKRPPKSTGRELFDANYVDRMLAMLGGAERADAVATAVSLTSRSIARAVRDFVAEPCSELIVSGGGARNGALVEQLRSDIAPLRVSLFDDLFYDGEAKEAVAFALLGYLHVARAPGSVTGATGARGPRVLGKLTPA